MDLQEIRKQLDSIDAEFVRLFEKRMKLCADVAEFKIRTVRPSMIRSGSRRKSPPSGAWLRASL